MKKIVIRAQKNGWLRIDPFDGFSMRMQERRRSFLTPEELSAIESHTFTIPRMQAVRDMFLFSCYTGFAYIDVAHLTRANLDRTPDGLWWLRKPRQKTKLNSQVPVLKPAMEIIRRYANINRMSSDARLFQVISNQKLNAYLKELADVCGIEKNLTFHVARHTFATTVIRNPPVTGVLQCCLGFLTPALIPRPSRIPQRLRRGRTPQKALRFGRRSASSWMGTVRGTVRVWCPGVAPGHRPAIRRG